MQSAVRTLEEVVFLLGGVRGNLTKGVRQSVVVEMALFHKVCRDLCSSLFIDPHLLSGG